MMGGVKEDHMLAMQLGPTRGEKLDRLQWPKDWGMPLKQWLGCWVSPYATSFADHTQADDSGVGRRVQFSGGTAPVLDRESFADELLQDIAPAENGEHSDRLDPDQWVSNFWQLTSSFLQTRLPPAAF
jgi:hypothetical protein